MLPALSLVGGITVPVIPGGHQQRAVDASGGSELPSDLTPLFAINNDPDQADPQTTNPIPLMVTIPQTVFSLLLGLP